MNSPLDDCYHLSKCYRLAATQAKFHLQRAEDLLNENLDTHDGTHEAFVLWMNFKALHQEVLPRMNTDLRGKYNRLKSILNKQREDANLA